MAEEKQTTAVATQEARPPSLFERMDREWAAMRQYMAELFRQPFGPFLRPPLSPDIAWAPSADAYVADGEFRVKADLPGVKKEDVSVTVRDGVLTIAGQRKEEKEIKEAKYYAAERFQGAFQRSFPLPEGVDTKAITAEFKDGVLDVRVPLPAEAKAEPTKIQIKA
jgi:HSP20 family protein